MSWHTKRHIYGIKQLVVVDRDVILNNNTGTDRTAVMTATVAILPVFSSQSIFDSSKVPEIMSPELTQYLSDHRYAIIRSNTTEWFLWHNRTNFSFSYIVPKC